MSETLAEEEKQRIRVELLTEIAKNEQDLEQCDEETGRYGREFLYNIRDLEQLCSITECPLTSHELKEFGIFPKKKNMFNRAWTHVKDIVTKPHKAEEDAARIARGKAEIEERMNRLEEQSRRSEEARIERDRIVKEQTERQREKEERQIRENAAHLEKERAEKAELEARIKMMEEQMRRSEEASVERERIAREEAVERFKLMEEQVRRSDEVRIEMEVSVKELAERHNRKEERCNREKAELVERIKMMEEQMRRSDEARIEMERWIEKEKERKIKEEEEKRLREEEARIEKEKAEAVELERKEKERIEKEEEDRKRKVVEERRLRIEADVKSLLALPYELRVQAYRDFDLEKRRELRINEELAEIELKTDYRYQWLRIERKEDRVELSNWIRSEDKWKKCYEVFIPIAEIEKELKIMGKNTQFEGIQISAKTEGRQIIEGIQSLKAKQIIVRRDSSLNEFDLRSIVKNRESVQILSNTAVTVNLLLWIYENMRNGQFELNKTTFYVNDEVRWSFLDKFGNFTRKSLTFTGTNPNQKVSEDDVFVKINQGKLTVYVNNKKDKVGQLGCVGFHFDC